MKLPVRPPEGYPHEQPSYKFFSDPWPPGYVPHLADEAMIKHQSRRESEASRVLAGQRY